MDSGVRTFGVVQDPLNENGVLGDPLGDQQDALWDAVTTQQRTAAGALVANTRGAILSGQHSIITSGAQTTMEMPVLPMLTANS